MYAATTPRISHTETVCHAAGSIASHSGSSTDLTHVSAAPPQAAQQHQAGDDEDHVEGHVMVLHVADFVAEDRLDLVVGQFVQELIGEHDVAKPWNDAGDHGVGDAAVRVPNEHVAHAEAEPPSRRQEPVTQFAVRQRLQAQEEPQEVRDHDRANASKPTPTADIKSACLASFGIKSCTPSWATSRIRAGRSRSRCCRACTPR